jgi:hypothetical protein
VALIIVFRCGGHGGIARHRRALAVGATSIELRFNGKPFTVRHQINGEAEMSEKIEVGYQTFVSDSPDDFGAIREISRDGRQMTVYVENAGDFQVPITSVVSVQSEKVTFDCRKLDPRLRAAIGHAHDAEGL